MKWFFIILFLALTSVSNGAVYYVSPSGNNSNSGTSASPWQTLAYACIKTVSGDIIHVTGTYSISSQISVPVGVSIEGDQCTLNSSVGSVPTLNLSSSGNTNGNQHISGLTLKGTNPANSYTGIQVQGRSNVKIYDCKISDFNYSGVKIYANNTPSTSSTSGRLPDPSTITWNFGNEIYNCTITGCGQFYGGNEGCLSILGQDGLLVHGNTFIANGFGGDHGDAIKGVSGFFRNLKICDNTITNSFVSGVTRWDFAIELWNYYNGCEFYNNQIEGSIDIVLSTSNGTPYSVWIHDNTISQPAYYSGERRGVLIEFECEGIIVERNKFYNLKYAVYSQQGQSTPRPVSNVRIDYNLMTNVGYGFIITEETDYGAVNDTYTNIQFYNNVVVAYGTGDAGIYIGGAHELINCEIKNNIIQGFNNAIKCKGTGGQSADRLYIQNNIFYSCGTQILWQSLTPTNYTNSGNLTSNPLFSNYHLQSGSPAINSGISVTPLMQASTVDLDKNPINNPPERGVYKYGSTALSSIYYVKSSGNDSNTGLSDAAAWKTVQKVSNTTFAPGARVNFNKGDTWNEMLVVSSSGNSGNYITFGSYGTGANPVFDGQNTRANGILVAGFSYIIIDGIDTRNATEYGIVVYDWGHVGSSNVIVKNSTASYNGMVGICLYIDNCSAINCTTHHNGTTGQHHGIYVGGGISADGLVTANNWEITNCISFSNAGYGFHIYHAGNGVVRYSKSYSNGSIANSGGGLMFSEIRANKLVEAYYNVIYSNVFYGIVLQTLSAGDEARIYNNTLYDNCDAAFGAGLRLMGNDGMIKIKNNLLLSNKSSEIYQSGSVIPYSISNNLYFGSSIIWNGITYSQSQFNSYKTASGDLSLSLDPLVNNFVLQTESPAINVGVDVGLTHDYTGSPIVGLPDIGAFESISEKLLMSNGKLIIK